MYVCMYVCNFDDNLWEFQLFTCTFIICTENPRDHKGSGLPKSADSEEGLAIKFFDKIFAKNRWFERKMCICSDLCDRMLSSFSLLKNADSEQNIRFFGPESRKGSGLPKSADSEEGLAIKFFDKIFAKNRWFERKMCICSDLCDRMLSSFSLLKNADSEQNIRFFGPESRSGPGGFPYKWRQFIIEISKENEAFESIWVKIAKSLIFHHLLRENCNKTDQF